jgi:hypothetical protein
MTEKTDKTPGNLEQDDDTKSRLEGRKDIEQPAGEFETEHDGVKPDLANDRAKRPE